MSRSPEGAFASTQGRGTKAKLPPADGYHGKPFDPKKLVCELDQKLKRLQMMSASEFEITDSAHKEPQKRRAKQEEPNARAKYNFKDGLLALGKNEGKAQGWRPAVKGGAHSYAGPQRKSPVKMEAERTGACSPEYNIYSDSDVMASEDGSPQKEGGSA